MSATYQDINFNEVVVTENKSNNGQQEKIDSEYEDNLSETIFLSDMSHFSKTSVESLQDLGRDSDESIPPPTPTSKSIREKIGSRIIAVKERRHANREKKREAREKVQKFVFANTPDHDFDKVIKRSKFGTVSIALIEASVMEKESFDDKWRFLCCRLRLGTEKRKSKLIKINSSVVKFQELLNINMFDDTLLEISLWDRDVFISKQVLDLSQVENEQTHRMKIILEEENSQTTLGTD
ncbi:unnamed protein product, partial [Iphiclides podalirius]